MSTLSRRLQVLIDDERLDRLRRESERTGAPVGAIVRDAIDQRLPASREPSAVAAAAERFLDAPPMPVEDWHEMKADLDDLYGGRP